MPLGTWNGPFDALLTSGGVVRVGEQREVTDEDLKSAHWTPVRKPKGEAAKTNDGDSD
jgi:hypothetical protein